MRVERAEIRRLALPMREPFAAAHGRSDHREITVVRIDTDEGHGWGECAALNEATYNDEFAAGAFRLLANELVPRLAGGRLESGQLPGRLAAVAGNPMAKAAIEMAILDVGLRRSGRSLAQWLTSDDAVPPATVPAGAVAGLGSPTSVADRVEALAGEGYKRIKIKIGPGHDRLVLEAVLRRGISVEVHVDGNGAYRPADVPLLSELAAAGIDAMEQPLPPADWQASTELAARCPVPLVADEAATSAADVERLHQRRAATGISVKPSRLAGLAAARHLHDRCVALGLPMTAGGMVETGLGRHALAALAALPGFTIIGDVSPARRWLAADPWPDLVMHDGRVTVPTGPGVAPDPDPDLLDAHTVERADVRLSGRFTAARSGS